MQEFSGTDTSLLQSVADGGVEKPPLATYLDWLSWRRRSRTRPSKVIDVRTSTPQEEATLWRGVMEAVYGEDWRSRLADQQAEEAVAAQEAEGGKDGGYETPTPGRLRGPATASASGPPAPGAGPPAGLLALPEPEGMRDVNVDREKKAGSSGGSSGQVTPSQKGDRTRVRPSQGKPGPMAKPSVTRRSALGALRPPDERLRYRK